MTSDANLSRVPKRAYAILAGGGVKGVALVGCLAAAQEFGFKFEGYAGTSAGSIVSLLASVGYTGAEIHALLTERPLPDAFLDADSARLTGFMHNLRRSGVARGFLLSHWNTLWLCRRLSSRLGVCDGARAKTFLYNLLKEKLPPALRSNPDRVTFDDLRKSGLPLLKILASDIGRRSARVYSADRPGGEGHVSVIEAVRASISYPFMFEPVAVYDSYLVDGGLTANLPFFLFDEEQKTNRLPVFAFDLVEADGGPRKRCGLGQFVGDLAATALESSQRLALERFGGVYRVEVEVPVGVEAFMALTTAEQEALYWKGFGKTMGYLSGSEKPWNGARSLLDWLQSLYAPPQLVRPILQAFAQEIERNTPARNVRAHVMLPAGVGTRIVVYQYGMDGDADKDLELAMEAGCSGAAWRSREPAWADLAAAQTTFDSLWGMTEEQQRKVRSDREAMFSIPVFETRFEDKSPDEWRLLGILSIDTDTSFGDTLWHGEKQSYVLETAMVWADILARVLT